MNAEYDESGGSTPRPQEGEIRYEERRVMRVIPLQVASFRDEIRPDMFLTGADIEKIFTRPMNKQTAIATFHLLCSPTPYLTRMIWELKIGGRSPNRYILPGGGGLDLPNPTAEEIIQGALLELKDETGHTTRNARLREDCTRWYGFDMHEEGVTIKRRNHESLVVAYIPRGQSTRRRFVQNENIQLTQRFTIEQVSHLLHDEVHLSSQHPGILIDNLSLNADRHRQYGVITDHEATLRTRTAIETEMWVYEARMWKRLAQTLFRTTRNHMNKRLRKMAHSIFTIPEPMDTQSATEVMRMIREAIPLLERSYPSSRKTKNELLSPDSYAVLTRAGIPPGIITRRLALIADMEHAYRDTFHSKRHRHRSLQKNTY